MRTLIHFCLHQKLVVFFLLAFFIGWGFRVAPFDWDLGGYPRDPVPVDAIPDLGDNQQIVFTDYQGRSPQDVEDQVTYPLTVSLLGIPGVREVRSFSMFGFSTIYLVFEEGVEFYWSRSRVLEKLNSLPSGLLPAEVTPSLGPDATALGQVLWYTLQGRDSKGRPAPGWNREELRTIQDFQVRYALLGAKGVAEVASIGGFVRQYQVEVDPDALRAHDVTLMQVADAVRKSNREVGLRNLAINGVEYIVRGTGYIHSLDDLRNAVVTVRDQTPITVGDLAFVQFGPAPRRGALDVNGADAVGGVVVARFGANPLAVLKAAKAQIGHLTLPTKVVIDWTNVEPNVVETFAQGNGIESPFTDRATRELDHAAWLTWSKKNPGSWPAWFSTSQVEVVPFYDRSRLIGETLNTLDEALLQQVLITIIVVIIMVMHLRSSLLISVMLPLAVLITFITMKLAGVDANVVALSGIAIAIGTVVDVGIVLTENILKHLEEAPSDESTATTILRATTEVGGAVTTSVLTTVVSFLPVFAMTGEAGRLFRPLAFTKTFALVASIVVALTILPPLAHLILRRRWNRTIPGARWFSLLVAVVVAVVLARDWMPLGLSRSTLANLLVVGTCIGVLLLFFKFFEKIYAPILRWCLSHKVLFLSFPVALLILAGVIWKGADKVFGWLPNPVQQTRLWNDIATRFPGLGKEFRPSLDEGAFLLMPTVSPHASIDEALKALRLQDRAIAAIPEVSQVVGKIGRAESALDPAPISMVETVINYLPEYRSDAKGRPQRFRVNDKGAFVYGENGQLVPDRGGKPWRNWRPHIQSPDDIWREIEHTSRIPGVTGAPKLQPIETRLVMLRTGMRAPMGLKIRGPSLESIEEAGLAIESLLRSGAVPGLSPPTVNADRMVGKPYLEIVPDREAAKRYGLNVDDIHRILHMAVGGMVVTTTVEGRERYGVQVRYARERRDSIEALERILITSREGAEVPLRQLASIRYVRGPQVIKSEDTFLTGYLTFGADPGFTEVDVVETARDYLREQEDQGKLLLPDGVSYKFAGSYESALEFNRTLLIMLPLCLGLIFLLLYLYNRSVSTTGIIFSGVMVAWAGGFLMLWLVAQPGFLAWEPFGIDLRELFQIHPVALSTAVWVGFLALFGIATDDGVVMATYLRQRFEANAPTDVAGIRATTVEAGKRRVRPCLMTTATTLLALLPVLTSTGRGSDIMAPMALPIFGGMMIELLTMFVVPVLFCWVQERGVQSQNTTK